MTGTIPSEIAMATSLETVWLHDNFLVGTVPKELDHVVVNGSLTALFLDNNDLSGVISEQLCSLGPGNWSTQTGLTFDCGDKLCGCHWCPCNETDLEYSAANISEEIDDFLMP